MTRTRILPLAALGLLALSAISTPAQAACLGIIGQAPGCIGVNTDDLPEEVQPALDLAEQHAAGVRDTVIEVVGNAPIGQPPEPPECTTAEPLHIASYCIAWLLGRIGPMATYLTGTGDGTVSGWLIEASVWSGEFSLWANGYATYVSDHTAGATGDATEYAFGESLAQANYALGRTSAASGHAAAQATLAADWFAAAQAEVATYLAREGNGLAAHEFAFVQATDAYLRGTESDLRGYAVAYESWQLCELGASCGPEPQQPEPRQVPGHTPYQFGQDPSPGSPAVLDPLGIYQDPSTGEYTLPTGPEGPGPHPPAPDFPQPPLEEESQ